MRLPASSRTARNAAIARAYATDEPIRAIADRFHLGYATVISLVSRMRRDGLFVPKRKTGSRRRGQFTGRIKKG